MPAPPSTFKRLANSPDPPEAAHARTRPRSPRGRRSGPLPTRRRPTAPARGSPSYGRLWPWGLPLSLGEQALALGLPACRRFAPQQPYRAEAAAGGSAPLSLSLPGARHSPPGASGRRSPEAGPCPRPCRGMKRIFGFGRKRKGHPPSGSASLPCPAGAYELRQKDLGKLHRAAASGDLAQVRQGLKKHGIDGRDKAER